VKRLRSVSAATSAANIIEARGAKVDFAVYRHHVDQALKASTDAL
jgi:hypothetical protein